MAVVVGAITMIREPSVGGLRLIRLRTPCVTANRQELAGRLAGTFLSAGQPQLKSPVLLQRPEGNVLKQTRLRVLEAT